MHDNLFGPLCSAQYELNLIASIDLIGWGGHAGRYVLCSQPSSSCRILQALEQLRSSPNGDSEWHTAAGGYAFIATLRFIRVQALDKLYRQKFSSSLLNGGPPGKKIESDGIVKVASFWNFETQLRVAQ